VGALGTQPRGGAHACGRLLTLCPAPQALLAGDRGLQRPRPAGSMAQARPAQRRCPAAQCSGLPRGCTRRMRAARRFIKWTQDAFRAGGSKAELLPLLERCTRELQGVERYRDDARYLRVWIQYVRRAVRPPAAAALQPPQRHSVAPRAQADCLPEPRDVFAYLKARAPHNGPRPAAARTPTRSGLFRILVGRSFQWACADAVGAACRSMASGRALRCTTSRTRPTWSCAAATRARTRRCRRASAGAPLPRSRRASVLHLAPRSAHGPASLVTAGWSNSTQQTETQRAEQTPSVVSDPGVHAVQRATTEDIRDVLRGPQAGAPRGAHAEQVPGVPAAHGAGALPAHRALAPCTPRRAGGHTRQPHLTCDPTWLVHTIAPRPEASAVPLSSAGPPPVTSMQACPLSKRLSKRLRGARGPGWPRARAWWSRRARTARCLTRGPARRRGACSARRPRAPTWARTPRRTRRRRAPRCRCCRRRAAAGAPPARPSARPARRSGPSARPSRAAAAAAARRTRAVHPQPPTLPSRRAQRGWLVPKRMLGQGPSARPSRAPRTWQGRRGRGTAWCWRAHGETQLIKRAGWKWHRSMGIAQLHSAALCWTARCLACLLDRRAQRSGSLCGGGPASRDASHRRAR